MMILQDTIISFRGPELTFLFKIFPFFASETFYIGVIALGYWLATNASVFWKLGFLIPFSTVVNGILKNIFLLERPEASLHLVHVIDRSLGFPSGDVHVATVLWGMILYYFQSRALYFLGTLIILCIMISRVYLGVHTVDQVVGGLFFGIVTVFVAISSQGQKLFHNWQTGKTLTYWLLCSFAFIFYILLSNEVQPLIIGLGGILLSYGLSAAYAKKYINSNIRCNLISAVSGMFSLVLINKAFPKIHFEQVGLVDGIFLIKYTIIGVIIFAFIPSVSLNSKILSRLIKQG